MTPDPDRIRHRLVIAGARREKAEADRAEAMHELRALCRAAHGRMEVAEMARLAGVARGTIYALLRSS